METLNERFTNAFNILIDRGVFSAEFNDYSFCLYRDELQFVTSYLSKSDMKIILSVCDLFSLDFGINYIPSINHINLSVIFEDANHG